MKMKLFHVYFANGVHVAVRSESFEAYYEKIVFKVGGEVTAAFYVERIAGWEFIRE